MFYVKTLRKNNGFTLIELVMVIVIAAVIIIPTTIIVLQSLNKAFYPEHFTIASSLLEDRIEWVTNLRFANVDDVGLTRFSNDPSAYFYQYFYQLAVDEVDPNDLNSTDNSNPDYKRVKITISRLGFPDVSATTLRTNN